MISDKIFQQICDHGTYFNPAWKHYGEPGNIICDKCRKNNLDICIGYQDKDLCLECVMEINKSKKFINVIENNQAFVAQTWGEKML